MLRLYGVKNPTTLADELVLTTLLKRIQIVIEEDADFKYIAINWG